jgi:hypothetical protein
MSPQLAERNTTVNTIEILTFVGIAAVIILTQLGRHSFTLRRFLLPLLVAGAVGYHYLFQGVASTSGARDFEILLTLAGIALGVLAVVLIRVERDPGTGQVVMEAGLIYAALWVTVFGGRLAFAWAATHIWQHQVAQFSIAHELTNAAWTVAFVLMAIAMVLARTIGVGARAVYLNRLPALPAAA